MILRGWKSIAAYCKVHPKTAQSWHYFRLRMPVLKSAPTKGGKISVTEQQLLKYLYTLFDPEENRMRQNSKVIKNL